MKLLTVKWTAAAMVREDCCASVTLRRYVAGGGVGIISRFRTRRDSKYFGRSCGKVVC